MQTMMLTQYQTQKGQQDQGAARSEDADAMGEAFDDSMNNDTFYLPPDAFDNDDFKRHGELHLPGRQVGALHHQP